MQGIRNIILGFVLLAVGGAVLMTVALEDVALIYGVWGLIALGAVLLVGGLYQAMAAGSVGKNAEVVYTTDTIARLVMQSTITTALADGPLDDEEVEMIATACESVVHEQLSRDSIRRVAKLVDKLGGDKIMSEIHSEGRLVNVEARTAILDACLLVLKSDNKVDVRQTAAVAAIARQLDYSDAEAQALIVDALQEPGKG